MSPVAKPKHITLGSLIDQLDDAREVKRALAIKVKDADEVYKDLESQIITRLDSEESRKGEGKKAGVSITEVVVAVIEDFDKLWAFAKRNNYSHLFQRRISDPAFRELLEKKGVVPGLTAFTNRNLNLRSL